LTSSYLLFPLSLRRRASERSGQELRHAVVVVYRYHVMVVIVIELPTGVDRLISPPICTVEHGYPSQPCLSPYSQQPTSPLSYPRLNPSSIIAAHRRLQIPTLNLPLRPLVRLRTLPCAPDKVRAAFNRREVYREACWWQAEQSRGEGSRHEREQGIFVSGVTNEGDQELLSACESDDVAFIRQHVYLVEFEVRLHRYPGCLVLIHQPMTSHFFCSSLHPTIYPTERR
jgi:hypothetical protein